ncbi:hypothetical protein Tco_0878490 [Tanacetum coccineum]|uniref:Uncharacterized protein n=1 Tax=Tanacetum coccineum TaxID=301880 RepID=A0ABQ5C3F4_9ASTR
MRLKKFNIEENKALIPRGLSIPGPIQSQSQPQQPSQATDPKDKGKGILVEEPKKKKLTLQQIRALETTNDEEVARKIQAEWDAEEERKRLEKQAKIESHLEGISMITELQRIYITLYRVVQDILLSTFSNGLVDASRQEEWEIIKDEVLNLQECIHYEIEDVTMITMLAEEDIPLSRRVMIRMLDP